jgi:murein DD-endopeptidase MepM/ murein hydrolase activator NlpD
VDPNSLSVSKGSLVTQGQLLGQYANPANGGATGPHLHFEWWSASGKRLDPVQYRSIVMPNYQQTDFIRFRGAHPVTGKARMHHGYDLIGPVQ